ncbi:MAG: hypothetical protein ABIB79_05585 [archaeon]
MVNQSKINDPRFWKRWQEVGAVGSIPEIEDIYNHNRLNFNLPNARGLKEEFMDRLGDKHILKVGKPKNVPIGGSYKRTEYSILMDNKKIGTLTRVVGPDFNNTVYEGRIPGYVNELIKIDNDFEKDVTKHRSVDQVILQHTIEPYGFGEMLNSFGDFPSTPKGPRKDGHSLRFVD